MGSFFSPFKLQIVRSIWGFFFVLSLFTINILTRTGEKLYEKRVHRASRRTYGYNLWIMSNDNVRVHQNRI